MAVGTRNSPRQAVRALCRSSENFAQQEHPAFADRPRRWRNWRNVAPLQFTAGFSQATWPLATTSRVESCQNSSSAVRRSLSCQGPRRRGRGTCGWRVVVELFGAQGDRWRAFCGRRSGGGGGVTSGTAGSRSGCCRCRRLAGVGVGRRQRGG